jgi:hypothetical protein
MQAKSIDQVSTPSPWLVRFFSVWTKSAALKSLVTKNGYLGYILKMRSNENCTIEIHRSQGPGVPLK